VAVTAVRVDLQEVVPELELKEQADLQVHLME